MIDTSAWSKQLPTIILFQNGKETLRVPHVDNKGHVPLKYQFSMVCYICLFVI